MSHFVIIAADTSGMAHVLGVYTLRQLAQDELDKLPTNGFELGEECCIDGAPRIDEVALNSPVKTWTR